MVELGFDVLTVSALNKPFSNGTGRSRSFLSHARLDFTYERYLPVFHGLPPSRRSGILIASLSWKKRETAKTRAIRIPVRRQCGNFPDFPKEQMA